MPTFKALVYKIKGAGDEAAQIAFTLDGSDPKATLAPGAYESVAVSADVAYETDTVPMLTAGSIDQTFPSIGNTLTALGSNADGSATYQWQQSMDDSAWSDISGATSASYDTTGQTDDIYLRRGVSDGAQGPVYTKSVQIGRTVAFTEYAIDHQGAAYSRNTTTDLAADTRYSLFVISLDVPAVGNEDILSYRDNGGIGFAANGQLNFVLRDSAGNQNSLISVTDFVAAHPGRRLSALIQTSDNGSTGTRIKMYTKIDSGAWGEEINVTRARPEIDFSGGFFSIGGDGSSDTFNGVMYGIAVYTDGNIGSGFDIGNASDRDAFFNADGTLVAPPIGTALIGTSPCLDTRGLDVAAMNAGANNGVAGNFDVVNGTYIAG